MAMAANTCSNCRFFGKKGPNAICRFNPPIVVMQNSAAHSTKPMQLTGQDGKPAWGNVSTIDNVSSWPSTCWPQVSPEDWCGKHKPPTIEAVKEALKEE